MSSFRIRPKFEVTCSLSVEDVILKTKDFLQKTDTSCFGIAMQDHITLSVKPKYRHFWSPQLSLVLTQEEEKTKITGLYGPMPNVWMIFAYAYLALSTLIIFISIIGFSQYSLGIESNILWFLPFLLGFILFLYMLSQFGQKLGAEQMFTLHHSFEEIIGEKIHIPSL
ncbi:MAG: hypothetical protein WAT79_06910 [Saprospiraceae bacterium]